MGVREDSVLRACVAREGPAAGRGEGPSSVQDVYFDCLTANVCPAIVIVPLRLFGWPVYGATEYVAVPLPLAPPLTVIQEALLAAVHAQPAPAVTATLPAPPAAGYVARVGEME